MKRHPTQKNFQDGRDYSRADWDDVSDNPEWTRDDFEKARPFLAVFPEFREAVDRARGRPPQDNPKQQITLRLDAEIVRHYRASGKGWQSRINADLRKLVGADQPD